MYPPTNMAAMGRHLEDESPQGTYQVPRSWEGALSGSGGAGWLNPKATELLPLLRICARQFPPRLALEKSAFVLGGKIGGGKRRGERGPLQEFGYVWVRASDAS